MTIDILQWLEEQKTEMELHQKDIDIDKELLLMAKPGMILWGFVRRHGSEIQEIKLMHEEPFLDRSLNRVFWNQWPEIKFYYRLEILENDGSRVLGKIRKFNPDSEEVKKRIQRETLRERIEEQVRWFNKGGKW